MARPRKGKASDPDDASDVASQDGAQSDADSDDDGPEVDQGAGVAEDPGSTPATAAAPLVPPAIPMVPPVRAENPQPAASNGVARTMLGGRHVRIVGEDGQPVSPADVFGGHDGPQTYLTVRCRVFEEFQHANTSTVTKQLLWPAGARVDRRTAAQFVLAHQSSPADADQGAAEVPGA